MLAVNRAADEALREAYDASDMLIIQFADSESRLVPVRVGGAVMGLVLGDDILTCIKPTRRNFALVEVFMDDAGGDELAVADGLIVLVVVGAFGLL